MKPRSLLILALLVVGLAAFVWFGRELPSSEEQAERAKRVLLLDADEVRRLEIEWGGTAVVLERPSVGAAEDGVTSGAPEWSLSSPIEARADSELVDGIVSRLVAMEKVRTLEGIAPAEVGLAEPRGTVRLETEDGKHVLAIGAEVPASSNMTLAVEGEDVVHVVGASIWSDLTKAPGEWRDKVLFVGQRGDIEQITLDGSGGRARLVRRGDDFWLESSVTDRADNTQVNSLLSTIAGLRAERFLEPAELEGNDGGLSEPRGTLEVVLTGGESPLLVALGDAESDEEAAAHFMRVDGNIVTSKAALLEHLERAPDEWRSKELVSGEVYELARVLIEDDSGTTELVRSESDWLRDGVRVDYGVATDLLYEISGGAAERVIDADDLGGLGPPALTLRLIAEAADGDDGAAEILRLYRPVGEETPAQVSSRQGVLMLSAGTASRLADKLAALRAAPGQPDPAQPGDAEPAGMDPVDGEADADAADPGAEG